VPCPALSSVSPLACFHSHPSCCSHPASCITPLFPLQAAGLPASSFRCRHPRNPSTRLSHCHGELQTHGHSSPEDRVVALPPHRVGPSQSLCGGGLPCHPPEASGAPWSVPSFKPSAKPSSRAGISCGPQWGFSEAGHPRLSANGHPMKAQCDHGDVSSSPNPMSKPLNKKLPPVVSNTIIEWHGQWVQNAEGVHIGIPMVVGAPRKGLIMTAARRAESRHCRNFSTEPFYPGALWGKLSPRAVRTHRP
jgi:hypothetical protein